MSEKKLSLRQQRRRLQSDNHKMAIVLQVATRAVREIAAELDVEVDEKMSWDVVCEKIIGKIREMK